MITTNEIRKIYLDFFKSIGHTLVPSDSLVPKDDPTLLFTGAGMNQFKENFMGIKKDLKRVTTCQKCLRTADLDRVGKTAGHHTFFEMLGNFSFGDYFKKETIVWAWELLTKNFKIPAEKLWVSVYRKDDEAYKVWKEVVKIEGKKIVCLGEKENFWPSNAPSDGPDGPCGPCSEIFFDQGKDIGCQKPDCSPACDCGRFVEIWNLVFTQFNRKEGGLLEPLPQKNIDTGMGLERIAACLQGVKTNFEIDIFVPIIEAIKKELNIKKAESKENVSHLKAIADHIRAVVFAISDGVIPSNEERGYVIRRLIREAIIHSQALGNSNPFLYKIVDLISRLMQEPYAQLEQDKTHISQIVLSEEEQFLEIQRIRIPDFENILLDLKKENKFIVPGDILFTYYDTYGLPMESMAASAAKIDKNYKLDFEGFNRDLEKQKERSRKKSAMAGNIFAETFKQKIKTLNLTTEFLGYTTKENQAKILAILPSEEIPSQVYLILDKTPFYAESGGQIGDKGIIRSVKNSDCFVEVKETFWVDKAIVHWGLLFGQLQSNEMVLAIVDEKEKWRREKIAGNHTATHLLRAALRKVLGNEIKQAGSLVSDERFRFDFTYPKKLEEKEIKQVEDLVNQYIQKASEVKTDIMDLEIAKISGATALFNEKYEPKVRVVGIDDYSKELCGGTHVKNTSEIKKFKIISEGSVAAGIRRIEAVTADMADQIGQETIRGKKEAEEKMRQEKILKEQKKKTDTEILHSFKLSLKNLEPVSLGDINYLIQKINEADLELLRKIVDLAKEKIKSGVLLFASVCQEKVFMVCWVSDDLVKRGVSASEIIKEVSQIAGGSGGGRPNLASAGINNPGKLDMALKELPNILKNQMNPKLME